MHNLSNVFDEISGGKIIKLLKILWSLNRIYLDRIERIIVDGVA